jgi:hypothetical protein
MRIQRALGIVAFVLLSAAFAISAGAQQPEPAAPPPPPGAPPHPPRHTVRPRPGAPAHTAAPVAPEAKPTLLGQFGEWGAYTATPGGKKICFAIAKPTGAETKPAGRPRNQPFMFITSRPADKVTNEISVAVGYPFKSGSEATVQVGTTTYALYTERDGAWIKNAAEESHLVDDLRGGETAVVKGMSGRGSESIDTYSLKGLTQALDRIAKECQ